VRRWGPTVVVVALLAATAVAFATTERQKLEKTPFAVVRVDEELSPVCRCDTDTATIALRVRRTHDLTVAILDADDHPVRTLARDRTVHGPVVFAWNGRDSHGRRVGDGSYRARVTLDDGRDFVLPPPPINVDSVAPRASLVSYRPRVLRRRAKPRVLIGYRVTEPAHVLLYVNGRRELFGGAKALRSKVEWFARRNGRRLRRGRYRLRLAAVDLAGNVGPRSSAFVIRVR
jgi:FlgD Ig-like domain